MISKDQVFQAAINGEKVTGNIEQLKNLVEIANRSKDNKDKIKKLKLQTGKKVFELNTKSGRVTTLANKERQIRQHYQKHRAAC